MTLKAELDSIYDQVYMIRESMSSEESSIFIAGFEDGINEGIGKWLGKAAGWISDIPNKARKAAKWVGDKASDLYNRGKEWAKKTVEKLKNWMSDAFAKVKGWMSDAGKWISEKFEVFVQKMKDAFSAMGKKLAELWEATKEKSKAFWEATKSFFSKMMDSIKSGYKSAKEWLYNMGGKASEWVKRNWERLKDFASRTKDKLGDLFNKAIEMIKKGGTIAKKWLDIVALYLITKPTEKIKEWLKKIPELYDRYSKMFGEWLDRQVQDFKVGFEEGSGRPWDRAKGFIEKPNYPEVNVKPIAPEEGPGTVGYTDPMASIVDPQTGFLNTAGSALKSRGSKIADVQSGALKLVSDPEFMKRFANYNDRDLKSTLRREGFTETALDFVVRFWNTKKGQKKRMPLPESFKYLKTFEGFSY